MKTKEEIKQEFINERTRIINEILGKVNWGIYPTTDCFEELNNLFDRLVDQLHEVSLREIQEESLNEFDLWVKRNKAGYHYNDVRISIKEFLWFKWKINSGRND